jgi:hypothetical protein
MSVPSCSNQGFKAAATKQVQRDPGLEFNKVLSVALNDKRKG